MLISLTLFKRYGILLLCEHDSESPALQDTQARGPSSLFPTSSPVSTQPANLEWRYAASLQEIGPALQRE